MRTRDIRCSTRPQGGSECWCGRKSIGLRWSGKIPLCLPASTLGQDAELRRPGLGPSVWRGRHESLPLASLHALRRGCTTCAPGLSPGVLLAPVHTCAQVSRKPEHLVALRPCETRTELPGCFRRPHIPGSTEFRG